MGVGEAVSKGFTVARKSLSLVTLLSVFGFIFNLLNIYFGPPPAVGTPAEAPPPSPAMMVIGLVFVLLTIYFQGGSLAFIRDSVKTGSAKLSDFFAGAGKYYLKLFLLGLIVTAVLAVTILAAALVAGLLGGIGPWVAAPVTILIAALGIYFVVLLFFSPYAVVVEEKGVGAAIKQSMQLVKKNVLSLLGISVLMVLIGFGIGLALGALLAGVSIAFKAPMATQIIFALLSSIVNAFLGVLVTGSFMNLYLSLPERNNT